MNNKIKNKLIFSCKFFKLNTISNHNNNFIKKKKQRILKSYY